MYLSDLYLGRMINILASDVFRAVLPLLTMRNLSKKTWCALLMPRPNRYVWKTSSWLLYKFQLLSRTEVRLKICVALFFWPDEFCAWLGCCLVIWSIVLVASWPDFIHQPAFAFDFQLNLVFHSTLLYSSLFTFFAVKLPSIYYLLCDQVTYRMLHCPIIDGIVWYVLVNIHAIIRILQ